MTRGERTFSEYAIRCPDLRHVEYVARCLALVYAKLLGRKAPSSEPMRIMKEAVCQELGLCVTSTNCF